VITAPAGQVVHAAFILPGPIIAEPEEFKGEVPDSPVDVVQLITALTVPLKLIPEFEPGQIDVEELRVAVGGATTVIVPVAFTIPHPPVSGML
jgi:hypothetical protein